LVAGWLSFAELGREELGRGQLVGNGDVAERPLREQGTGRSILVVKAAYKYDYQFNSI
jgi:hypothetical protein